MDPKAIDAGVGEVPSHPVDINIPSINGGHQPRHVVSENVVRCYPLVGESVPSSTPGITTFSPQQHPMQQRSPAGSFPMPAPTHHIGHIVREQRAG